MKLNKSIYEKYKNLPGWELVSVGLVDLSEGRHHTVESLLVQMYSNRLKFNNIDIPELQTPDDEIYLNKKLYRLLEETGEDAHSKYNALQRRMVSFCSTLESAKIK